MERTFEPKAQAKDLRTMKNRAHRAPEDYPKYNMIPQSDVMAEILKYLDKLNGSIKFQNNPIRKQAFYQLKSRIIQYFLTLIKSGQAPEDWSYVFNGLQDNPGAPTQVLAALELHVDDTVALFHTVIDNQFMGILFDECYQAPINEFHADPHAPMELDEILETWTYLVATMEQWNWFIHERAEVHGWIDSINNYYPNLKFRLAPGTNVKLATMLAGGPMIQAKIKGDKYSDVCKFNELRDNFANWLEKIGHRGDFSLCLKKDYII